MVGEGGYHHRLTPWNAPDGSGWVVVFGVGEISPAGWAGPVESSVGLDESPGRVVLETVMMPTQRAEVPGRGGAFRPRNRVVQIPVLCGALAAGEPAGVVTGANKVIKCGWWPVGVPGMFDQ